MKERGKQEESSEGFSKLILIRIRVGIDGITKGLEDGGTN